ncbi:hypothetical protein ACWGHM_36755 [Streptomyces sp. NPDC054904]
MNQGFIHIRALLDTAVRGPCEIATPKSDPQRAPVAMLRHCPLSTPAIRRVGGTLTIPGGMITYQVVVRRERVYILQITSLEW